VLYGGMLGQPTSRGVLNELFYCLDVELVHTLPIGTSSGSSRGALLIPVLWYACTFSATRAGGSSADQGMRGMVMGTTQR
jgi:hypothetical protein